jgi:hypothetical protein
LRAIVCFSLSDTDLLLGLHELLLMSFPNKYAEEGTVILPLKIVDAVRVIPNKKKLPNIFPLHMSVEKS